MLSYSWPRISFLSFSGDECSQTKRGKAASAE
jgi:hypothetical protein